MPNAEEAHDIWLDSEFGRLAFRYVESRQGAGLLITSQKGWGQEPVLVRLQSSCVFSESFHAGDCDCALQLHESLRQISRHGGVVVYLSEEGRGIGLQGKIRAIHLQQSEGVDTAEAYRKLELPADPRDFAAAIAILQTVVARTAPVRLLTNNLRKVEAMRAAGYEDVERWPILPPAPRRTRQYLREKARVLGHEIADLKDED